MFPLIMCLNDNILDIFGLIKYWNNISPTFECLLKIFKNTYETDIYSSNFILIGKCLVQTLQLKVNILRLDKNQDLYICCLQETHFKY